MKCIDLLNYKQIPENLIISLSEVEKRENIFKLKAYSYYRQFLVNENLNDWLKTIFDFKFHASYQVIRNGISIHKDFNRNECFNYLINSGGKNVITNFYDDNNILIDNMNIPEKIWHRLDVSKFHGIDNIENIRYSVSVTKI